MRELAQLAARQTRRTGRRASQHCIEERKQLERQLARPGDRWRSAAAVLRRQRSGRRRGRAIRAVGDAELLARTVMGLNPSDLRGLIDDGKKQIGSGVVAIIGVSEDGKAGWPSASPTISTKRINAVDLVQASAPRCWAARAAVAAQIGPQAGGPMASKAESALKAIGALAGQGAPAGAAAPNGS